MLKSIGISTLVDVAMGGNADVLDILLGSVAINYIDNEVVTMDQEKEADATGFNVMKHTAYNVGGAPSSMQFVYEKYGDLYTEGFKRVISPNNHPQMSSRIEKLAGCVTKWSGNHVQVGGDTVYVHAQPVVRPAADGDYSSWRRAFLVEGNLARVMNQLYGEAPKDNKVQDKPLATSVQSKEAAAKAGKMAVDWQVALDGQNVMVNGIRIMCAAGDNGTAIVQNLEKALQAKPVMLSKSEISKQSAAWKKKKVRSMQLRTFRLHWRMYFFFLRGQKEKYQKERRRRPEFPLPCQPKGLLNGCKLDGAVECYERNHIATTSTTVFYVSPLAGMLAQRSLP